MEKTWNLQQIKTGNFTRFCSVYVNKGGLIMKGFFKTILRILGFITALVGALAVFDKFTNKNRIENDYLDCSKTQIDLEDLE